MRTDGRGTDELAENIKHGFTVNNENRLEVGKQGLGKARDEHFGTIVKLDFEH